MYTHPSLQLTKSDRGTSSGSQPQKKQHFQLSTWSHEKLGNMDEFQDFKVSQLIPFWHPEMEINVFRFGDLGTLLGSGRRWWWIRPQFPA